MMVAQKMPRGDNPGRLGLGQTVSILPQTDPKRKFPGVIGLLVKAHNLGNVPVTLAMAKLLARLCERGGVT